MLIEQGNGLGLNVDVSALTQTRTIKIPDVDLVKGDILTSSGGSQLKYLSSVGQDGKMLVADSMQELGVRWADIAPPPIGPRMEIIEGVDTTDANPLIIPAFSCNQFRWYNTFLTGIAINDGSFPRPTVFANIKIGLQSTTTGYSVYGIPTVEVSKGINSNNMEISIVPDVHGQPTIQVYGLVGKTVNWRGYSYIIDEG